MADSKVARKPSHVSENTLYEYKLLDVKIYRPLMTNLIVYAQYYCYTGNAVRYQLHDEQ